MQVAAYTPAMHVLESPEPAKWQPMPIDPPIDLHVGEFVPLPSIQVDAACRKGRKQIR